MLGYTKNSALLIEHFLKFNSIENPYDPRTKVFEAYVQSRTPGACRIFWCDCPQQREITIIVITLHS